MRKILLILPLLILLSASDCWAEKLIQEPVIIETNSTALTLQSPLNIGKMIFNTSSFTPSNTGNKLLIYDGGEFGNETHHIHLGNLGMGLDDYSLRIMRVMNYEGLGSTAVGLRVWQWLRQPRAYDTLFGIIISGMNDYGTTTGIYSSGDTAGYFSGDVYIDGNLTVTGTISQGIRINELEAKVEKMERDMEINRTIYYLEKQ